MRRLIESTRNIAPTRTLVGLLCAFMILSAGTTTQAAISVAGELNRPSETIEQQDPVFVPVNASVMDVMNQAISSERRDDD